MHSLTEFQISIFIAQLGIIIFSARLIGELARRFHQPIVVGEVLAGIILGPAVFGRFFPAIQQTLFPQNGPNAYLLEGFSWLCVIFLLLITGLELDVPAAIRHSRKNILASILAVLFPFATVFFLASRWMPQYMYPPAINPLHVHIFLATALSVVAIPLIAKILFDFKILRSNVGLNILTSGILCDIWGWSILAIAISLVSAEKMTWVTIVRPIILLLIYLGVAVTAGRKITDKIIAWLNLQIKETAGILAFLFAFALINGAMAHFLGIHVIFGVFVAGLMAGESKRITMRMRQGAQDFIFGLFAPVFFVIVGMKLDFSSMHSWGFVILLLLVSMIAKIGGAYLGAILSGLGRRNALAVGCGLNTPGTMGVVVALVGHELNVFGNEIFAVIVLVSILSDLCAGPLLKWAMTGVRRPLAKFFDPEHVFLNVPGTNKKEVIKNMVALMAQRNIISNPEETEEAIWRRENLMSTAIGDAIALPHARIPNLKEPILCFFRTEKPIFFDSPDDQPVRLLFLELTDSNDDGMQLNLISQVARIISSGETRNRLLECQSEEEIHHILSLDEKA